VPLREAPRRRTLTVLRMLPSSGTRYALFCSAIFAVAAVQLAFWPLWLTSRGLDATEIGALYAGGLMARVAVTPLLSVLTYHAGDLRRVMLLLSAVALAGFCLFIPAHGFSAMLPITAVTGACLWALPPLTDSAVLQAGLDYGRVRLWGSLTFLVATLIIGRALVGASPDRLLLFLLPAGLALVGSAWTLPRAPIDSPRGDPRGWRALLGQRHAVFFTAAALIQASHSVLNQLSALYWTHLGYSTDTIGWLWADACIAEIMLFYWGRALLARVSPARLLMLGGIAGVVRWSVLATASALPMLIAAQAMHSLTFAATHLGAVNYLLRNVPAAHAGTAQLMYSIVVGIGFGIASLFSGALYQEVGGGAFFAMALMSGFGVVAAAALLRPVPP